MGGGERLYLPDLYGFDIDQNKLCFCALVELAKKWKAENEVVTNSDEENNSGNEIADKDNIESEITESENEEKTENGFWDYIEDKLFDRAIFTWYNKKGWHHYFNNTVYGNIRSVIKGVSNGKSDNPLAKVSAGKKYYGTVLLHSFAPKRSFYSFIEFVWSVYKKDFDFSYSVDDKDLCEIVADAFKDVVKNNYGEKPVHLGSSAYQVALGIKCLGSQDETRDYFIDLLDYCFLSIDGLYHRGNVRSDRGYITKLIEKWWKKHWEEIENEKNNTGGERRTAVVSKGRIEPKFVIDEENVVNLQIPSIRFEQKNCVRRVVIACNGKTVEKELYTWRGEFFDISQAENFAINNFIDGDGVIDFSVQVFDGEEVVCDKRLCRDYLLFDKEDEINKSMVKSGWYRIYTTNVDELWKGDNEPVYVGDNLYSIHGENGDTINGNNRRVVFMSDIGSVVTNKPQLIGRVENVVWKYDEKEYEVFDGNVLLLVPQKYSINGLELRIANRKILLSNIEYTALNDDNIENDGVTIFYIGNLLQSLKGLDVALYSYEKERELLSRSICVVKKSLSIKFFGEVLYYGECQKSAEIGIESCTNVSDGQSRLSYCKTISINNNDREEYSFFGGKLIFDVPCFKWKIDNKDWQYSQIDGVQWCDSVFNGSAVVTVEPNDGVILRCRGTTHYGGTTIKEVGVDEYDRFTVGRFICDNREVYKTLEFFVERCGREYPLVKVATQEHFASSPLITDGDVLRFVGDKVWIGNSVDRFYVTLKRIGCDDVTASSDELVDGVICGVEKGIYDVKITREKKTTFMTKKETLWHNDEFVFGDMEQLRLADIVLRINPLWGVGDGDMWKAGRDGYYITDLRRKKKDDVADNNDGEDNAENSNDEYFARIYELRGYEEYDVDGVSECEIKISSKAAMSIVVVDESGQRRKFIKNEYGKLIVNTKTDKGITNYNYVEVKDV